MSNRAKLIASLLAVAGLLSSVELQARQNYQIGGATGYSWAELGELSFTDVVSVAGLAAAFLGVSSISRLWARLLDDILSHLGFLLLFVVQRPEGPPQVHRCQLWSFDL